MSDTFHVRFTHSEQTTYRWLRRSWCERFLTWPWRPWRAWGCYVVTDNPTAPTDNRSPFVRLDGEPVIPDYAAIASQILAAYDAGPGTERVTVPDDAPPGLADLCQEIALDTEFGLPIYYGRIGADEELAVFRYGRKPDCGRLAVRRAARRGDAHGKYCGLDFHWDGFRDCAAGYLQILIEDVRRAMDALERHP